MAILRKQGTHVLHTCMLLGIEAFVHFTKLSFYALETDSHHHLFRSRQHSTCQDANTVIFMSATRAILATRNACMKYSLKRKKREQIETNSSYYMNSNILPADSILHYHEQLIDSKFPFTQRIVRQLNETRALQRKVMEGSWGTV